MTRLRELDPELAGLLRKETLRHAAKLELVPSANYPPREVLEALGSPAAASGAEGFPGRRSQAGCEYADAIEKMAVERARALFGSEYANVQPHSGTTALSIACQALLKPGDTVLFMQGPSASHGGPHSFPARNYELVRYGPDPRTEVLDVGAVHGLARKHRPRMLVAGSAAYPRAVDWQGLRAAADDVKAVLVADLSATAGLVAGRVLPGPVGVADVVTASTHQTLRGPRGGMLLARAAHAERLDRATQPGSQGAPHLHALAAKAAAFRAAQGADFQAYAAQVVRNAAALARELAGLGWGVLTGGTDTHLVVLKLTGRFAAGGTEAERRLDRAGITSARTRLPDDPPERAGGLALGSAAVTSRGMREAEMARVARFVHELLSTSENESVRARVLGEIADLFPSFPVYRELLA
ncbi:MAG: serine hydroxymethyltransferase [Planctomycetes bacterium]|nr:serine hydroxymethyltransferase [Planctomycetota bacterium]